MSSRDWVYEKFVEFYNNPSSVVPLPTFYNQREFAFLLFREKIMVRHRGFASSKAFNDFMRGRIPSDVYYSCAYYENPEAEMERKGWLGADLVFDIDADHIPTKCNKIHDDWKCSDCKTTGKGAAPKFCPKCNGEKFETKTWACGLCIESTKDEARKLVELLENDFGIVEHEIHTFFSGHRGFHIHVENEAARSLDATARKEIVDYVSGIGLSLFDKGRKYPDESKQKASKVDFRLSNSGWRGRVKQEMQKFIINASKEDLRNVGIAKKSADIIFENKQAVLQRCFQNNRWNSINNVGDETWIKLAEFAKNKQVAQIDSVVTTDIHRLIRMNGTLHGKTGLLKVEFPASNLDDFDPFTEAVAFKRDTCKVLVSDAPKFSLAGETFGPYTNKTVELPTGAAILLICKGRAEVAK